MKDSVDGVALLVIDMQRGLFAKRTPIYQAEQLLANVNALAARAHESGVPVFYVQHTDKRDLAEGSDGWQLHPALEPQPEDGRIRKRHGSAFQETPLAQQLQAEGITRLVVTGLVTHGCVKATCLDAVRLGYHVTLAADGHSSFSPQAAQLIEEWNRKLAEAGVTVRPSEGITLL